MKFCIQNQPMIDNKSMKLTFRYWLLEEEENPENSHMF